MASMRAGSRRRRSRNAAEIPALFAPARSRTFASRMRDSAARTATAARRSAASFCADDAVASCRAASRVSVPIRCITARISWREMASTALTIFVSSWPGSTGTVAQNPSQFQARTAASAGLAQDQVIAMDQLLAASIAEERLDVAAAMPHDAPRIRGGIGAEAARDFPACRVAHADGVAALEAALDGNDTGRKQALIGPKRLDRALVDDDGACGLERRRDKLATRRKRARLRQKPSADGAVFQRGEGIVSAPHGDRHAAARAH